MRVYATSRGLDPGLLTPGHDLVMDIDPAHGLDLAEGVLADDHLDQAIRWEIHGAGLPAVIGCREALDASLTVNGLCLPWLWELPAERALITMIGHAHALRRAVERFDADVLVLAGADARLRRVAAAVASSAGIDVVQQPAKANAPRARRPLSATAARRRAVRVAREVGVPSRLRPGSVVFVSYWPLMPLLDRMLADPGRRPAVLMSRLPTGPRRTVRTALRGGWLGTPGPADRRHAARSATRELAAAGRVAPAPLELCALELGAAAHAEILDIARARAASDLATAATLRRAFRRALISSVVSACDADPDGRLITSLAQAAGIRTLALAHGAYLLPQTLVDLDLCDEPPLWSEAVAPPITNLERPIHVVGYPAPTPTAPPIRPAPASDRPRVLVLAQPAPYGVGLAGPRIAMRQYAAAVGVLLAHRPHARIVLRPHPSAARREAELELAARLPGATF